MHRRPRHKGTMPRLTWAHPGHNNLSPGILAQVLGDSFAETLPSPGAPSVGGRRVPPSAALHEDGHNEFRMGKSIVGNIQGMYIK